MISFMVMSNMLSEQLKQQYKSKSVYWRQEKEKLLQTFQPKQNTSQSQQRSRTSERKSKLRNLVDSLYNQGTPDKNKSIYYQFQSQLAQQAQQQQQSSSKKSKPDELTLSTIINKYQKQVEICNQKQEVYNPIAEQIIESFQELKKKSAKKNDIQNCQSEKKYIENSAHKQNIMIRINQIRDFIDQQLGGATDESNKDIKYESQYQSEVDFSNLRNRSVEFRQILDQRGSIGRDSQNRSNHRIQKLRNIRSCTTLDVGIQVSILNDQQSLKQNQQGSFQSLSSHNNSKILIQNYDQQNSSQLKELNTVNNQQQTSPLASQSPYYQVEQSVTSEYQFPCQFQQQQVDDSLQKSKNSERMSRRSEFILKERNSAKERFSINLDDVNQQRFSAQERFSVNSNDLNFNNKVLVNHDFNRERLSIKSNDVRDQMVKQQDKENLVETAKIFGELTKNYGELVKNFGEPKPNVEPMKIVEEPQKNLADTIKCFDDRSKDLIEQKDFSEPIENRLDSSKQLEQKPLEIRLKQIEIPKIVHALNFDNIELQKGICGPQTSVDTNRFQIEIQQIMAKQDETLEIQLKQNEQNTNQQDFALTSNRSQLSVPITEPTNQNLQTNFIRIEEEVEALQPDIRIIENATGITEGNLQYSEDTANVRIPTQLSNNLEEMKYKVDSYVTCDIQFQQIKQDYQQLNQLQSTQSNQLNQSSFEQWLSQTDQTKKIFNFNCQSQYFQKEKCDHSTQINKTDSDDEALQIKKKQQLINQGLTFLVRKLNSIMKIRQIKAFYEIKEHSLHLHQIQQQQQFRSSQISLYQSPITSQHSSQSVTNYQSLPCQSDQSVKQQAAQEKISNLLKTIMEETGSDTLRMLKGKQSTSSPKLSERKRQNSSTNIKIRNSKKCSTASIVTTIQTPVQEINDRIKVNFIQEMGLESPIQKHTEHAELNDFSPIAEPMEFQDVSVLVKKREIKQIGDSNLVNSSYNDQRHCQILSNHIAIQKAKIAKKFQQIHYKTVGQFRKENSQF